MRVILDCDTANEIDDQFAIAYALGSPELEVLAIVNVHDTVASGPDSVDRYVEETERMLQLCGRQDVPNLPGARGPMETPTEPVGSVGLDFIAEQAEIAPLTVLATGPITDVASLALRHPHLVDRVDVIWAGAFPDLATWNRYRLGELNARADIAAWRALYASELRLTLLPGWPNVAKVEVDWREYVAALREVGGRATDYLAQITDDWCAAREARFEPGSYAAGRKVLWDVVNVALLREPSWVTLETTELPTIDAAGAPDYSRPSRSAQLCTDLDEKAILADLESVLRSLPR